MKFKYTILYVENVPETLGFYEKAFGLTVGFLHESHDYGQLATGDTCLSFSSRSLMQSLGKNPSQPQIDSPQFEIAFEVSDVSAALAQAIAAGAKLVQPVKEEAWGQETAYIADPNGFLVEICSPVSGAV